MRAAAVAEPTPASDDTSVSEGAPAAAPAKKAPGAADTAKAAKPSRTTKPAAASKATATTNSAGAKPTGAKTTAAAKTAGTKAASAAETSDAAEPADAAKTSDAAETTGAATTSGAAKTNGAAKTAKPAAAKATKTARTTKTTRTAKSTGTGRANRAAASESTAAKSRSNGAAKTTAKTRTRKKTTARRPRLQYKVGQQLVYPLQGVGQVTTIEERPFRDDTLLYYVVYLEVSDMTIMVPVEKADELGIRAIVPRNEANGALRLIGEDYEPIPTDWKLRYQMNLDLLKAGSVSDIATVVRALYHRSRIKELPILERKLYDNARSLLVDELSFSLSKDKDAIQELINARLEAGVKP